MKRGIAFIIALCLLISVFSSLAEEKPICLALGDSITTGYGLSAKNEGYAEIFAEKNGFTLINKAVDGNTAAGMLAKLTDEETQKAAKNADVIILTCGGNDLMMLLFMKVASVYNDRVQNREDRVSAVDLYSVMVDETDPRRTEILDCVKVVFDGDRENGVAPFVESPDVKITLKTYSIAMNGAIGYLKMVNKDAVIIAATQYHPFKGFAGVLEGLDSHVSIGVSILNETIRENGKKGGYAIAEVFEAFRLSEEDLLNANMDPLNLDIHPNAKGHEVIAQCFQKAWEEANKQN